MKPRNAIVGFCTNMPVERVHVFCKSAREVYDAETVEVVLITDRPDLYWESLRHLDVSFSSTPCDLRPSTRKFEKAWKRFVVHGARVAGGTWLDLRLLGGSVARFMPTLWEAWCHPFVARWNAYARVLAERPNIEKVLFTDVKDVVVQSDCFAYLDGEQMQLFMEGPLEELGWTARWIRAGFGDVAVRAMIAGGAQEVCAGTVLGTRKAAIDFLRRMQEMFARYPFRTVDQGLINWLLFREGDSNDVVRVPNLSGAVATLSSQKARDGVELRNSIIVRKGDDSPFPIVHMWDRFGELKSAILARYAGSSAQG